MSNQEELRKCFRFFSDTNREMLFCPMNSSENNDIKQFIFVLLDGNGAPNRRVIWNERAAEAARSLFDDLQDGGGSDKVDLDWLIIFIQGEPTYQNFTAYCTLIRVLCLT